MANRETLIQNRILLKYGSRRGLRLWRTAVGVVKIKGRWVRFGGPNGLTDICGLIYPGLGVYIETKTEDGELEPAQIVFRDMVLSLNGIWILARDENDVGVVLDPLLEKL